MRSAGLLAALLAQLFVASIVATDADVATRMPSFRELFPRFKAGPVSGAHAKKTHGNDDANNNAKDDTAPMIIDPVAANTLASILTRVRHSVVQIVTTSTEFNWLRPWESNSDSESAGSGFFVELDGHGFILTNGHVIEQAVGIVVTLPAFGKELFHASIFGVCHEKDVALLALQESSKKTLMKLLRSSKTDIVPLTIGNSDEFQQGSVAVAVGYPLGHPNLKASTGILSGNEHVDGRFYLQVTSPINPGNSGGPLLDAKGNVMGINTAAIESASNVGYALPIKHLIGLLHNFVADMKDQKHFSFEATKTTQQDGDFSFLWADKITSTIYPDSDGLKLLGEDGHLTLQSQVLKRFPVMGVDLTPCTEHLAAFLGYKGEGGVYVSKVQPFGLFKDAGVKRGDLLLSYDGHPLDRFGETGANGQDVRLNIYDLSERSQFKTEVPMEVWRGKEKLTMKIPFNFAKDQYYPIHHVYEPLREGIDFEVFGGLVVMSLMLNHVSSLMDANSFLSAYLSNDHLTKPKLVVSAVLTESTLIPQGAIIAGDVVKEVNGVPVNTLSEYRKAFVPKHGEYWTLETEQGALIVIDFKEALHMEKELAELNGYVPSDAVQAEVNKLEPPPKKVEPTKTGQLGSIKLTPPEAKEEDDGEEKGSKSGTPMFREYTDPSKAFKVYRARRTLDPA